MATIKIKPASDKIQNSHKYRAVQSAKLRNRFVVEFDPQWGEVLIRYGQEVGVDPSNSTDVYNLLAGYEIVANPQGTTLDTSRAQDAFEYLIIKNHKYFSDPASINSLTLWIYTDEQRTSTEKVSKYTNLAKAMKFVVDLTDTQRTRYVRLYGVKANSYTNEQVTAYLYEQCEKDSARLLSYKDDPEIDTRMLLAALIEHSILRKESNIYYWDNNIIGSTDDQAIEWLKNSSNANIIFTMKKNIGWVNQNAIDSTYVNAKSTKKEIINDNIV